MTEQEWLACDDPQQLLEFVRDKISDRKIRLVACACCRQIWEHLADERSRRAVEISEKYADGLVKEEEQRSVAFDAVSATIAAKATYEAAMAKISAEKWIAQLAGRHPKIEGLQEKAAEAARRHRAADVPNQIAQEATPSMVAAFREPSWTFLSLTAAVGLVREVANDSNEVQRKWLSFGHRR